jgi:hypothetical protein
MSQQLIFIPVLIQITLTLGLYIFLGIAKSRALKLGDVNEDRRGLHDDAWPDSVLKINNLHTKSVRNSNFVLCFSSPLCSYGLGYSHCSHISLALCTKSPHTRLYTYRLKLRTAAA